MTKPPSKPTSLDAIVDEAKQAYAPRDVDWGAVEERLERRLADEELAPRVTSLRAKGTVARGIGIALAAAAAAVLVVGRDRDGGSLGSASVGSEEAPSGGTLRTTEGSGEVRVGGVVADSGLGLRAGDVVETTGARAVFERPHVVTWMLEGESGPSGRARAKVTSTRDVIVLALEEGAIEAQVTRSERPETFAVDVSAGGRTVRVAVHGTHLRVARAGSRVVVDLTEGVVSIGVPPRTSTTYGSLVTAPAHVELDVASPEALRIDHADVRPPVPLGPGEREALAARDPQRPASPPSKPASPSTANAPATPDAAAGPDTAATSEVASDSVGRRLATPADVAEAVRACVGVARGARPEVKVTVATTLHLRVSATNDVVSAVFDPPLSPEVQTCAAGKIYGTKIQGTGTIDVPVQLSY